jgi:hypothetical protein
MAHPRIDDLRNRLARPIGVAALLALLSSVGALAEQPGSSSGASNDAKSTAADTAGDSAREERQRRQEP